ncbi:MAG: hypothetical protein ABIF11_00120 [Nitrospirota bacterium]
MNKEIQKEINGLKEQLDIHKENLRHLELQKAKWGDLNLPTHIATQIEDEENEIQRIIKKIQGLEQIERLKPEIQQVERLKPELQPSSPAENVLEATTTIKDSSGAVPSDLLGETEFILSTDITTTPKQAKFDSDRESYFELEINYDYMNPIFPALFQIYINLKVPAIKVLLENSSSAPFTNIILSYEMENIINLKKECIIDILNPGDSISKEFVMIVPDPGTLFKYERRDLNLSLNLEFKNQYGKEHEWARQLQLKIASKNSFIWDINGEDCNELLAAFITPHDPAIKGFLGEAREFSPNRQFFGYQKGREGVLQQVKAMYETLEKKGVSYVATSKDFSGDQAIKLPSQTLADGYGNCADSSVLFAAICEAIKINPILIWTPRHIFFGFEASRGGGEYFLLETTFVGNYSFEQAIKQGRKKFNDNRGNLRVIDITKARDAGIFPIIL